MHDKTEIMRLALEAGFALSTAYGQDTNKLMPISDVATLQRFAELLLIKDCSECQGYGVQDMTTIPCSNCKGTGKVTK